MTDSARTSAHAAWLAVLDDLDRLAEALRAAPAEQPHLHAFVPPHDLPAIPADLVARADATVQALQETEMHVAEQLRVTAKALGALTGRPRPRVTVGSAWPEPPAHFVDARG